jgi:LPS export ABC transporter protein LptC
LIYTEIRHLGICLLSCFLLAACKKKKTELPIRYYAGPLVATENLSTTYLDSGNVKMRMEAPLQLEFADGNQEFPSGFTVTIFQENDQEKSRLKADFVHFDKIQDLYTATGHVVLEDLTKKETLKTEKLHWSRSEARVFNNEYVEISTQSQFLKGKGLTAKQDFSSYTILEPEGTILNADTAGFF